jgi:hypothetical protein
MKYPSLQQVNLIVIDGRKFNDAVRVSLTGALLALAEKFDGHVLVVASSDETANKYELLGENAGLDFFFHGESVRDSEDFLERCAGARMVVMFSSWPTQRDELLRLRKVSKTIVLSDEVAKTTDVWPEVKILKAKELNAFKVSELITGTQLKNRTDQ